MKALYLLIPLSIALCSCGIIQQHQQHVEDMKFLENMAKLDEAIERDREQKVAEYKQELERREAENKKEVQQLVAEEQQREADEKRLAESLESAAKRLAKSTKLHAVEPINGSDLEEWREALKIGGFPFHPVSGRYTFSGDVTIIELNCVDNDGNRVFVETTIIGDKTIVKMNPQYVRVRKQ